MFKSLSFAGAIALSVATPVFADNVNVASETGTAAVVVVKAITIKQVQALDFGAVTSGAVGTVAILPQGGERQVTGGVGAVAQFPGQAGQFDVTGVPNGLINVAVGVAITGFKGGITGATLPGALPTKLAGGTGLASFAVGGVLTIPANTSAGTYTGSYNVAVNYP